MIYSPALVYVCTYVYIFWILSFFRTLRHHSASVADENSLLPLELALLFITLLHTPVLFFAILCVYIACFLYVVLLLATHVASYYQLHNIKIISWGQVFTLFRHRLLKLCIHIHTYIASYTSWKCKDKNIPIYAHYIQRFMLRQLIYLELMINLNYSSLCFLYKSWVGFIALVLSLDLHYSSCQGWL